ncbi:MAG: hypothetical protein EON61_10135 [Alphaproteobacteria bacterium]|jgi:hypothetical protein|nr:MAG: hypothetical protein EON61_10135 [Alphaproteobacteria bacterium]
MIRRLFTCMLAAAFVAAASAQTSPAPSSQPHALMYYAGQPGRLTQDRDKLGGNPFASALVEVLSKKPSTLEEFTQRLAASNARHSGGWQQLQFPRKLPKWKMDQPTGKRIALVLINSDYSKTDGVYSLPGAAFDAKRIPEALTAAGFDTTLILDASADAAREAMAQFSKASEQAEASIIYVGGHGMQHKRTVYWMSGDYPARDAKWLDSHAIPLDEIGRAGHARDVNLVLYASCRDDPFS